MATFLQHPLHDQHPLETRDFSKDLSPPVCHLCKWKVSADGYACLECKFYAHRLCAEAPPRIDLHPLHPQHPLTLALRLPPFMNNVCDLCESSHDSLFVCVECRDFNLDIRCALYTLSDREGFQGKTSEQIMLPLHNHPLTSFSIGNDFIGDINCVICKATSVEGDGYMCLRAQICKFLVHKRCIQDMYYTDGTKAPRIYHRHPLKTFLGEDMEDYTRCENCRSDELSGEVIGCAECPGFYCRDCVQVPETIQYPHHPDHTLVLLITSLDKDCPECDSCLFRIDDELYYGCPSCEFFVDLRCALQVLAYCGEGMSTKIELSWHKHQLHLCHITESDPWHEHLLRLCDKTESLCSYCEDKSAGPMYICKEKDCEFILHKRCTEIESTIIHPHHPDHRLTLGNKAYNQLCEACTEIINFSGFSCELCEFYLHAKCAAHVPIHKHSLHEHKLIYLEKAPSRMCKRCRTKLSSPFFRCVPCDLNLHKECMELPLQEVNNKVHWHPLTLHETYIEDDSGEYYCDHCEKSRDVRFGAYVCLQCSQRWAYHIECVFPQLRTIYEKKSQNSIIRRFKKRIARKNKEVRAAEVKLEGMKRELDQLIKECDELMKESDELMKESDELISGEEHYETATDESEQE